MSLKHHLLWDKLFKLVVLVGTPLMGWIYFSQHSDKNIGRTSDLIVPFRVEQAASLEGVRWEDANVSVVNFWATWCAPCVEEMPAMAELASRLKSKGINFYFVSVDESWEKVDKFLEENIIDLPRDSLILDSKKETAARWKSEKFPETYIVNREGWTVEKIVGFQDWTRPSVISYFERLGKKFEGQGVSMNRIILNLAAAILPMGWAQDKGAVPLIHEDDKKNLGKLQLNVETANKNVSKLEAALKEEERSLREVKIKVEREQKDRDEVSAQLTKVKDTQSEVDRVRKKNDDSLSLEKSEKERVLKDAENLQVKLKELEKELDRTRDEVILTNQKISTRMQNIESFEKALASSQEELKSLKDREKKLKSNLKKKKTLSLKCREMLLSVNLSTNLWKRIWRSGMKH